MKRGSGRPGSRVIVLCLVLGALGVSIAHAETIWVHTKVEIDTSTGEQTTRFMAFATSDEAGTRRLTASQLCIKGVAYRSQEKCEENISSLELVERTTGLPGLGTKCGESTATATLGSARARATARACP
jgi:hypothetical protein